MIPCRAGAAREIVGNRCLKFDLKRLNRSESDG